VRSDRNTKAEPGFIKRRNRINEAFSPRTIEMLKSPAYRTLSLSAHRVISRIEIELSSHGGNDNGHLPVTKLDFMEYGVSARLVPAAIREAHELGFIAALLPSHLRGHAYVMLGSPQQAAAEFQRILAHRGSDPFSPFHAVAPLGLARARAAAGDTGGCIREYERFAAAWPDADRDLPVLREAKEHSGRVS